MQKYVKPVAMYFFLGPDGTMRSQPAFSQTAVHMQSNVHRCTLADRQDGNSSTPQQPCAVFGGAPNMGCDCKGPVIPRSLAQCGAEFTSQSDYLGTMPRGKRLVVQMVETFGEKMVPVFVDELDACKLAKNANLRCLPS